MTNATIAAGAAVAGFLVLGLAAGRWALDEDIDPGAATWAAPQPWAEGAQSDPGVLHGRITTVDGATYEGRLRFGGDEEAYWGDYFNGFKDGNPWVAHVTPERRPKERIEIEILGVELAHRRPLDLRRPFMARFGDIVRIEARGRDLWVKLKSGALIHLDRFAADDFADGLRVWDGERGVVDLDERRIRSIEFLPPSDPGVVAPRRLHGTVRTRAGDFTGFLQWDREEGVAHDTLEGHAAGGELLAVPFTTIRSIERRSEDSAVVKLLDGHEMLLSGTREVGRGNRGIYVDDRRYGRVLVSWDAFERVDFSPGGSAPGYRDFPPGRPLTGTVITRSGRRLAGRLVYDLDESEIIETLDAPARGVDYTIPFGLVASIELSAREKSAAAGESVTLWSGEELQLERSGDLGDGHAGLLVFTDGHERPEYVPWADVGRVDFDAPSAMYPPIDERR